MSLRLIEEVYSSSSIVVLNLSALRRRIVATSYSDICADSNYLTLLSVLMFNSALKSMYRHCIKVLWAESGISLNLRLGIMYLLLEISYKWSFRIQQSKFIWFNVKPRVKSNTTLSNDPINSNALMFLTKMPSSSNFWKLSADATSAATFNPSGIDTMMIVTNIIRVFSTSTAISPILSLFSSLY